MNEWQSFNKEDEYFPEWNLLLPILRKAKPIQRSLIIPWNWWFYREIKTTKNNNNNKNKTETQNISHCSISVYDSLHFHKSFVIHDKHLKMVHEFLWIWILIFRINSFISAVFATRIECIPKKHIVLSTQVKKKHFYTKMRFILFTEKFRIFFYCSMSFFYGNFKKNTRIISVQA